MFMLVVLLFGVLFALWRGGRIAGLVQLRIRHLGLFFVPLLLQLAIFPLFGPAAIGNIDLVRLVYLLSMAVGVIALLLNRHLPGVLLVAAGLACNLLVISLNGGFMPANLETRAFAGMPPLIDRDNNVVPMGPGTVLWWLGDYLPLPAWMPLANVFSPGDLLITLGALRFIYRALLDSSPVPKPDF